MQFHHYLEVDKLRKKFNQPVKNNGQIRSSIWGVGLNSGFWPEYIPLSFIQGNYQNIDNPFLRKVETDTTGVDKSVTVFEVEWMNGQICPISMINNIYFKYFQV